MPVYMFTYHAYRSWSPDDPRGFVQDRDEGIQPPNPHLAQAYDDAAAFPPFLFDSITQTFLIGVVKDVCGRRSWRVHAVATEPTHLHALVSWQDQTKWSYARGKIKNIMSLELAKRAGTKGRPWFVDEASRKQVRTRDHFEYLMTTYLPKHTGRKWFESPLH